MKFEPMLPMSPATREILRKHDEQNEMRERFYWTMVNMAAGEISPAPSCCPDRRCAGLSGIGTRLQASAPRAEDKATRQTRVNAHAASTIIIEKTQRIVIYTEEQ